MGDTLLAALDGGRAAGAWKPWGKDYKGPGGCALPPPVHLQMNLVLTNGTNYSIGFCRGGGLLYVQEGLYEVNEARGIVAKVMEQLEEDLRREIMTAPKPCVYTIGTVDDGYTLSGVARLFYKDANKWPRIHEANRGVLKNPHSIKGGERLTIPRL